MGEGKEFARKSGMIHKLDYDMSLIWITKDSHHKVGNFVLIHCMSHSKQLGCRYFSCQNAVELNDVKSILINNNFKIDWSQFNDALGWLNG